MVLSGILEHNIPAMSLVMQCYRDVTLSTWDRMLELEVLGDQLNVYVRW
jgi:hypothetical protein